MVLRVVMVEQPSTIKAQPQARARATSFVRIAKNKEHTALTFLKLAIVRETCSTKIQWNADKFGGMQQCSRTKNLGSPHRILLQLLDNLVSI